MKTFPSVAHPWHGISPGVNPPERVTAYIEIVPLGTVKFEIDKQSGHLKVDRPQLYSSLCPALYGFIPQTFCDERVAQLARTAGRIVERGDQDPLDICVITERAITHTGFLVTARPIGGLRLLDKGEADDKIIAVLHGDPVYATTEDITDLPDGLVDRLRHYFLTYKEIPHENPVRHVEISDIYGREAAYHVIRESFADYQASFPGTGG